MRQKFLAIQAEKRRMTIGQLTDALVSGDLRRECGMSKDAFATEINFLRAAIRKVEGLEVTPNMRMIFSTAAALRIKLLLPEAQQTESVPHRGNGKGSKKNS